MLPCWRRSHPQPNIEFEDEFEDEDDYANPAWPF